MPLRRLLAASALVALPSLPAASQPTTGVDGRRLSLGVDSLAVFFVSGTDTVRTGLLRDELTVVDEGGRRLLRRVYASADRVLGTRLDTLVDVAATLAPVRHRSLSERSVETLDFGDGRVTGWLRIANGDSVPVAQAVPAVVYNASTFDLLLRASDLREGWSAEVPAFLPSSRTVATLRARVTGIEMIAGESCWRVEAEFTGMPVTFWISRSSRALRQQVMQLRPDRAILFRPARPAAPNDRAS